MTIIIKPYRLYCLCRCSVDSSMIHRSVTVVSPVKICHLGCELAGGPKEAQVQSYSPGGAIVPTWEGTLASPGEYNWTICLWRRCGLMSNYFDHLLLLGSVTVLGRCSLLLQTEQRGLSVWCGREPCQNGWTGRNAVWVMDSGGPKEPCITWGSRSPPHGKGQFWGGRSSPL